MYVLKLVSTNSGGSVQGFSREPAWAGWIPIESVQFGSQRAVGLRAGGGSRPVGNFEEIHLIAKMPDLDVAVLYRWAAEGETANAVLHFVPAAVGGEGTRFAFSEALITSATSKGQFVDFTLTFAGMEMLPSRRFR